ncbi:MAG: hypothetical protein Unbinned80contig1000_10 [Prokaryotic dsDNA virus sp.]|nr:MAG: hypothetical protein Unbinned80contig1000_10 [Prokaryotic dsDNA virus sp.]|tara:strand:- start:3113 stop:5416 length:2304 start_codon:yes stop_codon:yes gene_type:complete
MANSRNRTQTGPYLYRSEGGKVVLEADDASEIKNFVASPRGTLEPVLGPTKLISYRGLTESTYEDKGIGERFHRTFLDSRKYGIHHAVLPNGRDVLLLHTDAGIQEYQPQNRLTDRSVLKNIVGNNDTIASEVFTLKKSALFLQDVEATATNSPQFPTQFVTTDKGIVIVPQSYQRSYIYDGTVALPLGYDAIPSPPIGRGPTYSENWGKGPASYSGYVYHTSDKHVPAPFSFGDGRIGTTTNDSLGLRLQIGTWRCSSQWIDYFGNFSPMSDRSGEVKIDEFIVGGNDEDSTLSTENDKSSGNLKKSLIWESVDPGPEGTVGRRLYRTKDLLNSGDGNLYFLSGNVGYTATSPTMSIPDNVSTHFADNVPDGYLSVPAFSDIMPVPSFKLAAFCLGRLWIGNTSTDPGMIVPSLAGRYGTFRSSDRIFPDTKSSEITGLIARDTGLLAFTEGSTFAVVASDDGRGFKTVPISSTIGCVAPSSIVALPDGSVCWLGRNGFYRLIENKIENISGKIQEIINRITKSREKQSVAVFVPESEEYRCWVPMDGNQENSLCLIFDGSGWRRRTNEHVSCACISQDHRKYIFAGGSVYSGEGFTTTNTSRNSDTEVYKGFFVLDRENNFDWTEDPLHREYVVETNWISWESSIDRVSAKTVYLSLVESHVGSATIEVYRDWRKSKPVYTTTASLKSEEDVPHFWGSTTTESFSATGKEDAPVYQSKRPYWTSADISVPSCEVYKIRVKSRRPFEFIALTMEQETKNNPKTRIP